MDLTTIRYFVHVAEVGKITTALQDLHVAQPALTRRIQRLEAGAGTPLFLRLPRGVQLTAAGRDLLEHGRRILREIALADESLAMARTRPGGHVALGVPGTLTAMLVPLLVERIRERFPKLTLSVAEGTTPVLHEDLLAGRLDLAILNNPPNSHSVQLLPLTSETMVVVSPPQSGAREFYTVNEVTRSPVIVTRGIRAMVDEQFRSHGRQLRVEYEISSPEAIRRLLFRGIGLTILPVSTFRDDIASGRLAAYPVRDVNLHRVLAVGYLAEAALPAVRALGETIRDEVIGLATQGYFSTIPETIRCTRKRRP
jgi:LysR family transcriptional regulator, nitrogen assimilation regulatory protein